MRHRHRRQPARREQAGFGRAHEQHAILARVTPEHLHGALLGSLIEIDQQVAAEHEVVGRRVGQQAGVEQIADWKRTRSITCADSWWPSPVSVK